MRIRSTTHIRLYAAAACAAFALPLTAVASDCGDKVQALLKKNFAELSSKSSASQSHAVIQPRIPGHEALMKAKSEMAWAKSHFDQFIGKYEMSEEAVRKLVPVSKSELPPHVADGLFGAQGNVVIVSDHEKLMALKIIKTNKFDSDVSASYAQDPLIIQKSLSDLHAAPQLYGVVPQEALLKWMDQHPNGMDTYGFPSSVRVKYGVLMELLEAPSIKLKRTLTDSGFKSPQDQVRAKELSSMVNELGIRAQDMDYIYNLSGELMLIDFDYYAIRASHP